MNRCIVISSLLFASVLTVWAQPSVIENKVNDGNFAGGTPAALTKAAEKAQAAGDHFLAFKYFEAAVKKDSSEANLFAYAAAAERVYGYDEAAQAYQAIILKQYPKAMQAEYQLGKIYYKLGRYDEAGAMYDKVAATASGDLATQAKKYSEESIWASQLSADSDMNVEITRLGESVNTEFSEFAPYFHSDTLYFSSLRFPFDTDKHKPERVLGKILEHVQSGGNSYTNMSTLNRTSEFDAHTALNKDGSIVYYTICNYVSSGDVACQLYMRNRMPDGKWSEPIKLPDAINTPGKTTTQPSVGYDKLTGQEVLFFVSDRADSKGQRDIYSATILPDGSFAPPVNLTAINTPKDDITPFFHRPTGVLYFSTDGNRTLGGYDIFKTIGNGLQWSEPVHLGSPINSASNDLYYTLSENGREGWLASNRPGSLYYDTIGCCYDIYHADLFKPEVIVETYHRQTGAELTGTRLQLLSLLDEPKPLNSFDVEGYQRNLEVGMAHKYQLIVDKPGFDTDTLVFTTEKDPWKEIKVLKLYLQPMQVNLVAQTLERRTSAPLYATTFEFRDLGFVTANGTLAQAKTEAEAYQKEHLSESTNTFARTLEFNHRYWLLAKKDGYTIDSVLFSTEGLTKSTTIEKQLLLTKGGIAFEALSYDASTGQSLSGVEFSLVEMPAGVIDQRVIESTNQFVSGVAFGKYYQVIAHKSGYESDTVKFTTTEINTLDFTKITKKLYLRAAGMFPIIVYFDNDEPMKRTMATVSKKDYSKTYSEYIMRKSDFISLSPDGDETVEEFFNKEVTGGWNKLNALASNILQELQSGNVVVLELSGFASPRAANAYNRNLTSRRISSVQSYFKTVQGGVLRTFIDAGKLRFESKPQGEETAKPGISDSIPDEKNSIYTISASRERRAQVTNMRVIPRQ